MAHTFTPADCRKSAISRHLERAEGLAYAARWRARNHVQFVLPRGVALPTPGQARPTAYVGRYPFHEARTCADLIAEGVL